MITKVRKTKRWLFIIGPSFILLVWGCVSWLSEGNELFFASPTETFLALRLLMKTPQLYMDIGYTIARSLIAIIVSIILAIPISILITFRRSFYTASEFIIDFFRSIPSTALFPLFLMSFGLNDMARIGTAVFICFWIILLNLIYGVHNSPRVRIEAIALMGGSRIQTFKHVLFWETLVFLFSGIRLSVSTSMIIIIITEMLVTPLYGLGARTYYMQQTYKIPQMYALIIVIGTLSYLLSKCIVILERRIIHWAKR